MAKYYLAIDKGTSKLSDESDRYVNIDISKLGYSVPLKRKGKTIYQARDYFTSIDDAIAFTSKYENYAELFKTCYDLSLIGRDLLGKPFTYSYYSKKTDPTKSTWKHYGDYSLTAQNKVIFKDDIALMKVTDGKPNILNEYLKQELNIPSYFDLDKVPEEEQKKFEVLNDFCEKAQHMINEKKKANVYQKVPPINGELNGYTKYVNHLQNDLNDIRMYLHLAKDEHTVRFEYFFEPIKRLITNLCLNKDGKIDKAAFFELVSFTKAYQERDSKTYKIQLEKLILNIEKEKIEKETGKSPTYGIQLDMWGNEVVDLPKSRKRKK